MSIIYLALSITIQSIAASAGLAIILTQALAEQQARRERREKYADYVEMAKWLTAWRSDPATAVLSEAPVYALQKALKSLDEPFKRFFKKAGGYPRFKRKGVDGFRETDKACFALESMNSRIQLPKIRWVRYRNRQSVFSLSRRNPERGGT